MSKTSALGSWRHPTASVSSSIPPSISAAMVGKKLSLPASPDLNLTPHQLILGPAAVSHRSQLPRLDGSALEGRHNTWPGNTVMPSKLISLWTSTRRCHGWPGAGSARHPLCLLGAPMATTQWHKAHTKGGQPSATHGLLQL